MCVSQGNINARKIEQGGDKFGRWSYMKLSAPHAQVITIVTAYKPCKVMSATGTTAYHQQLAVQQLNNTEIKNTLGFRGSFTADIFFQSFGMIALLIPFSLIVPGINIIMNKKFFLIIESIFYTILYSGVGSLFFSNARGSLPLRYRFLLPRIQGRRQCNEEVSFFQKLQNKLRFYF